MWNGIKTNLPNPNLTRAFNRTGGLGGGGGGGVEGQKQNEINGPIYQMIMILIVATVALMAGADVLRPGGGDLLPAGPH